MRKGTKFLAYLLAILMVVSVGTVFGGCKAEAEETTDEVVEEAAEEEVAEEVEAVPSEPVTISYWEWSGESFDPAWDKMVDGFKELYPNVTVERKSLGYDTYNADLKTALVAGEGPDLFGAEPGGPLLTLIEAGVVLELTDIITGDAEWSSWIDAGLKLRDVWVGDKIYQAPMDVNLLPIIYWKEMFESRNLEVPTTIDEAVEIADVLNADGITPLVSMFGENWSQVDIFVYLVRAGDPDNTILDDAMVGEESWTHPLFKEALEGMVKLRDEKVFPNNIMELLWGNCLDSFNKKEAAMVYPIGQFGLGSLDQEALANDEIGTMPFLKLHAEDREMITGGGSAMTCVNADGENIATALAFLKFMNSEVGQEAEFDILRTPPGSLVTKESDIPLFTLQTNMQNNMEVGYRRINSPELYKGVQDAIANAMLGDNIDDVLADLEAISQKVN